MLDQQELLSKLKLALTFQLHHQNIFDFPQIRYPTFLPLVQQIFHRFLTSAEMEGAIAGVLHKRVSRHGFKTAPSSIRSGRLNIVSRYSDATAELVGVSGLLDLI
jgi:hypothetical protein